MEPFVKQESLLQLKPWRELDSLIEVGITSRLGGYSQKPFESMNMGLHVEDNNDDVIRNRELVADYVDFPLQSWVCGEQVHGNRIIEVTKIDQGKGTLNMENAVKAVDGFYTKERNILLTACYADCVPLYFFAPNYQLIGIAHAGWKGTVQDIAGRVINAWVTVEQVPVSEIYVCIGPSIGKCCYTVDDHVIDKVKALDSDMGRTYTFEEVTKGQYKLDLKQVNNLLLKKAGILTKNIEISTYCTSCNADLFYSHRRDQGKTGRMIAYIGLKE